MINKNQYIAELIAKQLSDVITADEKRVLDSWRNESLSNEQLYQKLIRPEYIGKHFENYSRFAHEEGWEKVNQRIQKSERRKKLLHILSYAAAIILPICVVGSAFYFTTHSEIPIPSETYACVTIEPGQAKAILTLDDGKVLNITGHTQQSSMDDLFMQQDSATINFQAVSPQLMAETMKYNKVEIPRGGEYKLILSDGTKVHLNSMSSLRFPVCFSGNSREVELIGEAFFEVSPNARPFIVTANGMQVEVLGTVFNVLAYPDENLETTLVSGSVKINVGEGDSYLLKPSQQAILSATTGDVQVHTIDTESYVSWVNGIIHFKDRRLEDIMKTLSRWYDMDIEYATENLKNIRFGCYVDKYDDMIPFVKLLEQTGKLRIDIKDKRILFYN